MADTHDEYIPVRKLNVDGHLTLQFVRPDGTVHHEELPLLQAIERRTYGSHPIGGDRYGIVSGQYHYFNSKVKDNLKPLSDTNPLLFEEVLSFLETSPKILKQLMVCYLINRYAYPVDGMPPDAYYPLFRALMDHAPMMNELECGRENPMYADLIFIQSRKLVPCEHPHFKAALLTVWILKDTGKLDPFKYADRADDIAYVDSRFDEIFAARNVLAASGSISRDHIENVLMSPAALRDGVL